MIKKIILIFLILFFSCSFAYADLTAGNFTLTGYFKNEMNLRLQDMNNDLTKFKNILELSGEYVINEDLVFFTKMKYFYEAMYDMRDKFDSGQHYQGHIQRTDWLRDCYIDYINGPWFLRLGKQQVAWGQSDGITILDRVNPVDLREFWLQDFVDIRIPLWMANINFSPRLNSNLQILIIPDFEASASTYPDGPFLFYSTERFENWRKAQTSVAINALYPGKQFENSTFGIQWSDRIGDLEYTLNYLNGFYYSLRNRTTYVSSGNWIVDRSFKRYRLYGGSLRKTFTRPGPLQGITLRGDFAYYNDEPTYFGDPVAASAKGVNRWDNVFWLIGLDKNIATNWLLSFQFAQYIMQDAKAGWTTAAQSYPMNAYTYGYMDQVENIFTIKLSTDFMHDRLKTELLWTCTDDNQGRISPKINYEIKDNVWLSCGIHYFYGNLYDTNGQFREDSQFYTHLKYTF